MDLMLNYQPTVDIPTGRLVGVEALLRLSDGGSVEEFFTLLETAHHSLRWEVESWCLGEALGQARYWQARYGDVAPEMAINVSPSAIDETFAAFIVEHAAGLNPALICLEVTERAPLSPDAITILCELAGQGFKLAIDDFGMGHGTLHTLLQLPVTELKIDKSFVAGLGASTTASAITASLVRLGRDMGLMVVAEGVETEIQRDLLRELDCPRGQGWLWARALPAGEVQDLIAA